MEGGWDISLIYLRISLLTIARMIRLNEEYLDFFLLKNPSYDCDSTLGIANGYQKK